MRLRCELLRHLAGTVFLALFGAVYEQFSHGVYSNYMIFAFLIPLLGGAVPYTLLSMAPRRFRPGIAGRCLYNSGLATLTAGSLFRGVLEIYGTTSRWSPVYAIAGGALTLTGAVLWLFDLRRGSSPAVKA